MEMSMSNDDNALPGDPYDDCDGCQRLLYEKRQHEWDKVMSIEVVAHALRQRMESATDDERLKVLGIVGAGICSGCGVLDPRCQCQNDE